MPLIRFLISVLFCVSALFTTKTHAFLFMDTSDRLLEVAPIPTQITQHHPHLKNLKVGYKCHHFALIEITIRLWECELIAMQASDSYDYYDLPGDVISILVKNPHYSMDHAQKTFWMAYGLVIFIFIFFSVLAFIFIKKSKHLKSDI